MVESCVRIFRISPHHLCSECYFISWENHTSSVTCCQPFLVGRENTFLMQFLDKGEFLTGARWNPTGKTRRLAKMSLVLRLHSLEVTFNFPLPSSRTWLGSSAARWGTLCISDQASHFAFGNVKLQRKLFVRFYCLVCTVHKRTHTHSLTFPKLAGKDAKIAFTSKGFYWSTSFLILVWSVATVCCHSPA